MASIREEIAKNILFYRKKAGLTQKELASKLGVKNTAVSNWESGNNSVDIETLFSACEILGVSLSDIYGQYSGQTVIPQSLRPDEKDLLQNYQSINHEGQRKLLDYSRDLVSSGNYQKGPIVSVG